jgi:hypothetical protein
MTMALLTASKPGYETASTQLPLASGYNTMPIRMRMLLTATEP